MWFKVSDTPHLVNALMTRDAVADLSGQTRSFRLTLGTVGWCRLTVSTPVLKPPRVSALETIRRQTV